MGNTGLGVAMMLVSTSMMNLGAGLYDSLGTLALTVELSGLLEAVLDRLPALFAPAAWMNPAHPGATIANTHQPCLMALLEGLDQAGAT